LPIASGTLAALAFASGLVLALDKILSSLVSDGPPPVKEGWVNAILEGSFVLFETSISLFSNTLSFVRVGAFAVAHGALGLVILILANRVGPTQNLAYWTVVALGNLVLIAFEGLIVAIQTLRLEYYEFFGKFFSGSGVPYEPLTLLPREQQG
jgi:V/A-type H+-transporting ATPase subunit I